MSPWRLRQVCHAIRHGGVVAYPTDTIWGFGCHPTSYTAIQRLLAIKQRPLHKGLILLSANLDYCRPFVAEQTFNEHYQQLAVRNSPPRTWIVKASDQCPYWLSGNSDNIAIRITDKPLIKQLCDELKAPLVSTSANQAGRRPARNRLLIRRQFGAQVDFILEDAEQHSRLNGPTKPSEIVELTSGKTLRP